MDSTNTARPRRLLRLPEVLERYPVSRSVWWDGIAEGIYPQGVKLSKRTTAWLESDIDALVERAARGELEA